MTIPKSLKHPQFGIFKWKSDWEAYTGSIPWSKGKITVLIYRDAFDHSDVEDIWQILEDIVSHVESWDVVICRKSSRCLHHRLRKISLQDLKRRIAVQTAVRLHSVIEINKAAQLLSPVFRTVKQLFLMPHRHQGADSPFRLTVGLRTGNPGKLLTNPVLITGYTESMVGEPLYSVPLSE